MGWREHLADTRPLQQPDFRRLWSANIITVIGAQLTVVAVPAQIYAITKSSAYVGLTGMFGLVPLVVLGLYGGADPGIPLDTVERMKGALAQGSAGAKASQVVVYPDAPHAFHADYRPSFRQAPAEDGWKRALAWFKTHGVA